MIRFFGKVDLFKEGGIFIIILSSPPAPPFFYNCNAVPLQTLKYNHPQILADRLTLSQPVGADYAHQIIVPPPEFQTFLRPWE